jgi:hypothetical protein
LSSGPGHTEKNDERDPDRPRVVVVIELDAGRVTAHLVAGSLAQQRLARRLLERRDRSPEAATAVTALLRKLKRGGRVA